MSLNIQNLIADCKEANSTFTYAEHIGDRGQTAFDVRANVGGVRVGLSTHVCVHRPEQREAIETALLETALEGLRSGIEHWTTVSHKVAFAETCSACRREGV